MTDDEDRTRVVSPNTIPRGGVVAADDDDRTAVMKETERAQILQAVALARAPLDFDLSGDGNDAPAVVHPTLDFDLSGGNDAALAAVDTALDLDLGTGETSIPVIATAAVSAAVTPPPVKAQPIVVATPATSGGIGKWIAIALAIAAAVLATVFLRK